MKKNILLLLCLFITFAVVAQKQQGLVRTIERPGQKSEGIKGATVKINEYPNALVSGKGGKFSFSIPGKKQGDRCLVTSVTKKGYTMTDKLPSFAYSFSTPAEIVMVSNKQFQQDEQRIRDKAEKKAAAIYEKRIAELERQLNEKTISEEQYREQLQQVFDGHENFLKMINEMARRYAMTDYKGISEINRQIQECIENAEFERANSLINSKGDMGKRKQEVIRLHEENDTLATLLKKRQEEAEFKKNDLAQDYYDKYYICAARYDNDSAAYYLEERASLDTTNVEWLNDAGEFIKSYIADYDLAFEYYQKGLKQAQVQYGEESILAGIFYGNVGETYVYMGKYDLALEYICKGLDLLNQCQGIEDLMACLYNNIGVIYYSQGDYNKALEYYLLALDTECVLDVKHPRIASYYNNIGYIYSLLDNADKALEYYEKAIVIYENQQDTDQNLQSISTLYNNLGIVYYNIGDFVNAMSYYQKALAIREQVLGLNHPDVATSYNNIGSLYWKQKDYDSALVYLINALKIRERILGADNPIIASSYNNIGAVYSYQCNYEKALEYYLKAVEIIKRTDRMEQSNGIASSYNNIGDVYRNQGDYVQALEYYQKALAIWEHIFGQEHRLIATSYNNIGLVYYYQGDYGNALENFLKALDIRKQVLGFNHSDVVTSYNNIGMIYYKMGDYSKALEYLENALGIRERILGADNPATQQVKERIDEIKKLMGK